MSSNTTRRILVLGAAPEDATPETHIMAGPWAFAGQEDRFPLWDEAFTIAPPPFPTPEAQAQAQDEAHTYAISRIPDLALRLGAHHGADLPRRFWDVALAPWLALCSQMLVERQRRAMDLVRLWGHEELDVILLPADCSFSFHSTHDFILHGAQSHTFNHWVFSRILEGMLPKAWNVQWASAVTEAHGQPERGLKHAVRSLLYRLPFPRIKGFSTGRSLMYSLALCANRNTEDKTIPLDSLMGRMPQWSFDPDSVVLPSIPGALFTTPVPRRVKPNPKKPVRIASVGCYYDDPYRLRLARAHAEGARLVFIQHGGNYGHVRTYGTVPMFEYAQHAFLTWGWTTHGSYRGNFVPMPHAQLQELRGRHRDASGTLVLVGAEMSTCNYRLDSKPQPMQFVSYRRDKVSFLSALPDSVRTSALYRPYFDTFSGLEDAPWVLRHVPDVQRCTGSLDDHMLRCRLLVLDHHGTTLELAMAANIPLVLYWNQEHWPLCPETEEALHWLTSAGIYHPTPASAAAHVARIWDDVPGWWNSEPVQEARRRWSERYALTTDGDFDKVWIEALRKL